MIKVAMIGAGSVVFSKNLTGDILSFPEFKNARITYMDVDADRLEVGANLCRKVARTLGADPKIEATLDRRQALAGADFVINMVQIGGFDSTLVDFEIPRKYGLNFTIADTTGPGGLFRALRTFPMLTAMCRDMTELCPAALLLNYSNPMSMNMQTLTRASNVHAVGLCHSVQGTLNQLMGYIGQKPEEIAFLCAGVNHMAFYLKLQAAGQDLYPQLFEAMKRQEIYETNKVRFELMRRLGYFVTESSEHNAEYSPYFMAHGPETIAQYSVPVDEYLRRCDAIVNEFQEMKLCSRNDSAIEVYRSHEYGSAIIHSMVTGQPRVVYGNMPNRGAISNLPDDAIAEAPTLVDRSGLHFLSVGKLPPQLVGYMQPHVTQHELFIRAAMEGRRDHLYQAAMFDPLTAATLSLDKIVELCDELIAAHGDLLPPLDAKKSLVPTSEKSFGAVDPKALRKSWDDAQDRAAADFVRNWHVIGPFKTDTPGKVTLEFQTSVDRAFGQSPDGRIDLQTAHHAGGESLAWRKVKANTRDGFVNFTCALASCEWCVGYAYTEIESVHSRSVTLKCGSDDGIAIWLNGRAIHTREIGRPYTANSDHVAIHLDAGVNRILVKIDNYQGGWGFGLSIPRAMM